MLNMALGTANVLEQRYRDSHFKGTTSERRSIPKFRRHPGLALAGASPESPTAILQRLSH